MFVVIVSRGFPTKKDPTNGIFEFDQAKALASLGMKIVFLSINTQSLRHKRPLKSVCFDKEGIDVVSINCPLGRVPFFIKQKIGGHLFKKGLKIINEKWGKPDLIHAHYYFIASFVEKYCTKKGIKYIVTEHSSVIHKMNNRHRHFKQIKKIYEHAEKVICVSNSLMRHVKSVFNVESIVIHNVLDTESFYYTERKNDSFNLISVGELKKIKRIDLLIEYYYRANFSRYGDLFICGDGPEKERLLKLIQKFNLTDHIHLLGRVPRPILLENMKKSNCFVLLSKSETFGVAFIEAIASGIPVISSKCGGTDDFINGSNGLIIGDDYQSFETAVYSIMNNYNSSIFKIESLNIKTMFSPKTIGDKLIGIYKGIMEE